MSRKIISLFALVAVSAAFAAVEVDVDKFGAEKYSVSINVSGSCSAAFTKCLKRNLELSGRFVVQPSGSIKVSGTVGGSVTAEGRGKALSSSAVVTDDKSARMAARQLSDAMCEAMADQKGFACDRIVFVSRKGKNNSELCTCYPDGGDIRQVTGDAKAAVGPRWKNRTTIFYTGYLNDAPQIWELDVDTGKRSLKWSFRGLSTGAVVSPDGTKVAIILSFQGNPELYVIDIASNRWLRMTNTPGASEGCPAWSPDGKKIVYVSDETRHPQLYIVDVASKAKRRLTSKGSQNVDPDWGRDGRITYLTKRGGQAQIAVIDPSEGESSAKLITTPGSWEHPSWSRDMRHVVAGRDKALFIVDSLTEDDGGDAPRQVFLSNGNWINPSWSR